MYKYHLFSAREYQIWYAGQTLTMQAVTISHAVHETANDHFWLGVLVADTAHPLAALPRC